jgi:hypothetical protein
MSKRRGNSLRKSNFLATAPPYGWINSSMPTNPNTTVVSAKYAVRIAESYRGRIIMLPFAPSHRAAGRSHAAQKQLANWFSNHRIFELDHVPYRGASQ